MTYCILYDITTGRVRQALPMNGLTIIPTPSAPAGLAWTVVDSKPDGPVAQMVYAEGIITLDTVIDPDPPASIDAYKADARDMLRGAAMRFRERHADPATNALAPGKQNNITTAYKACLRDIDDAEDGQTALDCVQSFAVALGAAD